MTNTVEKQTSRQMLIVGNDHYRKYIYIEDGEIVDELFFKIENGLEVRAEEPEEKKCSISLPENYESADSLELRNPETGEVIGELQKTSPREVVKSGEYHKIYNQTQNIGEIHRIVNGVDVEIRFFRVENGKEVYIPRPDNDERKFVMAKADIENDNQLTLFDMKTHEVVKEIPRKHVIQIDDTEIEFSHEDMNLVHDIIGTVKGLSEENKIKFKKALSKPNSITTIEGRKKSLAEYDEVRNAVEDILSNPDSDFYKAINTAEEFGISRFVSDRVYHLPELLREPKLIKQDGTNTYIVRAEIGDSQGNKIKFEHRFPSKSEEAAQDTSKVVIQRLQTVQHKIWLGAWQLANKLGRLTYTCQLTTLMRLCHPERGGYFSTKEKIQFFEDLRSLENTKILFSKKTKPKRSKQAVIEDFEIRLLEIEHKKGTQEKYPSQMTLTILNPKAFQNQKMAFVPAGFKHKTLELHADDSMLAQVIQSRKSQRMDKKFLRFERTYLMEVSGLKKTNDTKKSVANKKLLQKLKRLEEKGVIIKAPSKITDTVSIRIR